MKVLITGGYGFIGSHTANRFYKEGHEVFIIDNLISGKRENVKIKHKFYNLNVSDRKCEEIFKMNSFDVVIYLSSQLDSETSVEFPYLDTKSNLLGLINMLDLSVKYGIKKFIFASSAAVYGNTTALPITEHTSLNPINPYGMNKSVGEFYCEKWRTLYGINTICFRFSNVYGPRQHLSQEAGVISVFIEKILNNQEITVYGDEFSTRDFIYVEDSVYAIYKASICNGCKGIYNLSTNTENSVINLIIILANFHTIKKVCFKRKDNKDILRSKLDNTKIYNDLEWYPKHSLKDGLKKTFNWYKKNKPQKNKSVYLEKEPKNNKKIFKILPYLENILVFVLLLISNYKFTIMDNFNSNMIIGMAYIVIFGILYGKKQATLSIILAFTNYLLVFTKLGGDLITLTYEHIHLIQLALYILVGIITGYSIEKKNTKIYSKELEILALEERYKFLEEIYNETRLVKNELQKQIVNKQDSLAQIYKLINNLSTYNKEEIFVASIKIIEDILHSKMVSIHTLNESKDFLRLKARSNNSKYNLSNSIRIEKDSVIFNIIQKNDIYINKTFEKNIPLILAPIFNGEKTICYISIHEMDFDNLTQYYINLLKTLVNLISSHLIRAYQYEEATQHKKYIEDTTIMKESFFKKSVESIRKKSENYDMTYSVLKITNETMDFKRINDIMVELIRDDDYLGYVDNNLYILLNNSSCNSSKLVIDRLEKNNIQSIIVNGECIK